MNLFTLRKNQFVKEEQTDNVLKNNCYLQCPYEVQNYFLNLRQLNRQEMNQIYHLPFYSKLSAYEEYLKLNDTLFLKPNCNCLELQQVNEKIEKCLKK